ncbi:ABC transporter substrate-binding protein [Gryllotalpicola reticulitermitis]|uniref:ABC transporter substrate-binding protein n=1 Tax=Gryllotalpicola reticulitermitis TaxID=1184153 RepID=A0ABV8Q8A4_9MICO
MRKVVAAAAVSAALALTVAGCSSGSTSTSGTGSNGVKVPDFSAKPAKTLLVEGVNPTDEVATSRVDYADAKLKSAGVTVTLNKTTFDPQKFTAQIASGKVPDLIYMDRADVATYASKGLVVPLDQCFKQNKVTATSAYYPAILDAVKYQGDTYAIPEFWQTNAIMLNQRVLQKAGVTAADFNMKDPNEVLVAAKKVYQSSGGKPTVMGFDPAVSGGNANVWLFAFGGGLVDSSGKPTLNSAANIKAFTWLKQLYDEQGGYAKAASFVNTFDYFGNNNQYVKDQVGAELVQQWYPAVLTAVASKIDISGVPLTNTQGQPIGVADGNGYAIPTASKNPQAACQWALDMTSTTAWNKATTARLATDAKQNPDIFTGLFTGSPSADKAINAKQSYAGNTGFQQVEQAFNQTLTNGVSWGSSPVGQQVATELSNAVEPAMTGSKTVTQALDAAQTAAMTDYNQAQKK